MSKLPEAIAGLGFSRIGREDIGSARVLAVDAVAAAAADAGLSLGEIDGLILTRSPSAAREELPPAIQIDLGLQRLRLLCSLDAEGASSVQAVQHAVQALRCGMASVVACVFADARLEGGNAAAGFARSMSLTGIAGWEQRYGLFGPVGAYALAARRYMHESAATQRDLGAYAIACREWAQCNPQAMLREPLTIEQYLASRWVVEPLRLLDCAYPVNGAIAVVIVRGEHAARLSRPPVFVHGMGQCHVGETARRLAPEEISPVAGAGVAAAEACRMAGITVADLGMCQLYDPFSSVGLQLIEAYGLCPRGEAGAFVRAGHTSPGGRMPVNTGGGHLSGHYLQGMTPVSEAVIQAREDGGARQVPGRRPILVAGMGGRMNYHATLVLSGEERLS